MLAQNLFRADQQPFQELYTAIANNVADGGFLTELSDAELIDLD